MPPKEPKEPISFEQWVEQRKQASPQMGPTMTAKISSIPAAFRRVLAGELHATWCTVPVSMLDLLDGGVATWEVAEDYLKRAAEDRGGRFPVIDVADRGYVPLMFNDVLASLQEFAPGERVGLVVIPVDPDEPDSVYDPLLTPRAFSCRPSFDAAEVKINELLGVPPDPE